MEQALNTAEILLYITTFTDVTSTINLAMTNKQNYQIITGDPRFKTFGIIYAFSRFDCDAYDQCDPQGMRDCISLLKTNRYNYYKIAQSSYMWLGAFFHGVMCSKSHRFYKDVSRDKMIVNRPAYNPLYHEYYYNNRYLHEEFNELIFYELSLREIVQHRKYPSYNRTVFSVFASKFPLNVLPSRDSMLANHITFSVSIFRDREYLDNSLRFTYKNLVFLVYPWEDEHILNVRVNSNKLKNFTPRYDSVDYYDNFTNYFTDITDLNYDAAKQLTQLLTGYFYNTEFVD